MTPHDTTRRDHWAGMTEYAYAHAVRTAVAAHPAVRTALTTRTAAPLTVQGRLTDGRWYALVCRHREAVLGLGQSVNGSLRDAARRVPRRTDHGSTPTPQQARAAFAAALDTLSCT